MLVVHDPSRRAKCAADVAKHGLFLGSERRQWLFDAITASVTPSGPQAPSFSGGDTVSAEDGPPRIPDETVDMLDESVAAATGSVVSGHNSVGINGDSRSPGEEAVSEAPAMSAAVPTTQKSDSGGADGEGAMPWRPSAEALEAGGLMLFEEVKAAAPSGYFSRRVRAGSDGRSGMGAAATGDEETLDWVFDRRAAERVAKGKNTDLVQLEVVMVLLKEQVRIIVS